MHWQDVRSNPRRSMDDGRSVWVFVNCALFSVGTRGGCAYLQSPSLIGAISVLGRGLAADHVEYDGGRACLVRAVLPDGTLTEAISRRGRRGSIPRWMRWHGWPCTMLVGTTIYGQLVGVYDFHTATLLLLGLPTVGAMLTGYFYGNGRRIWCMYLCPANGVFNLIARVAPVHFYVDEQQWKQFQGHPPKIVCRHWSIFGA